MDNTQSTKTPQPLEPPIPTPIYKKAGFLERLGASIIDSLILLIVFLFLYIAFGISGPELSMLGSISSVLFGTLFIWKKGATPGKMLLKLKVVTTSYQPVSLGRALLRESVGKWISGLIFNLGYWWVLIDRKRQAWHDKIEKTLVVKLDNTKNLIPIGQEETISTTQKVVFLLFGIAFLVPLIFLISYNFFLKPFQVSGEAMSPTYKNKEYLMASLLDPRFQDPKKGDVLVFHAPTDPEKDFIKRVIATPGDEIYIKEGFVYVNNSKLDENKYLDNETRTYGGSFLKEETSVIIPRDSYIVMGDNRAFSSDSREWGFLPKRKIVGKIEFCYWNCSTK
ncbi:MAG TPA: signal peptidase I [Xanthomonadales bacterium]|nr:signal peptidase I [Xanthomonadales bacterium]